MSKLPIPEPQVPKETPRPRSVQGQDSQAQAHKTQSHAALPRWVAWAPSVDALDKAAKVRSGLSPQLLEQLAAQGLPVPVQRSQSEAGITPADGLELDEFGASPLYDVAVAATPGLVLPATGALLAILTPMVGPLAILGAVGLTLAGMAWAAKRTFDLLGQRSRRRQAMRLALSKQPLSGVLERLQALQLRLDDGSLPTAAQADLQASVWELWERVQSASSTPGTQDDQALIARLTAVEATLAQTSPSADPSKLEAQARAAAAARKETP